MQISEQISIYESLTKRNNSFNDAKRFLITIPNSEIIYTLLSEKNSDEDFIELFNYYIWIFREEPKINSLINTENFPTKQIIKYIFSSMGRWIASGRELEDYFKEIANQFQSEKSLQILLNEKIETLDVSLGLAFISNLRGEDLDFFLNNAYEKSYLIEFFMEVFDELEEQFLKSFFIKNPGLYASLIHLITENINDSGNKKFEKFKLKFKQDIDMIQYLVNGAKALHNLYNLEQEKVKPFYERKMDQIVQILHLLENEFQLNEKMDILSSEGVIIDKSEVEFISSVAVNPHLRNMIINAYEGKPPE